MFDIYTFFKFQNDDVLSGDAPAFTPCFQDTVLVYIPFGWLLVSLPFYFPYLYKKPPGFSLPLTAFSVTKSVLCAILLILTLLEVWAHDTYGYLCQSDDVPISFYVGVVVRSIFYIIVTLFIQYLRVKRVYNSGILYTFWILLLFSAIIPLQWKISFQPSCTSSIIYYIYFAVISLQCILHSFADKAQKPGYQLLGQNKQCPEGQSSVLNRLSFWWMSGVVITAYRKTLGISDLWDQTPDLRSDNCIPILDEEWQKEVERCKRAEKKSQSVKYEKHMHTNGRPNGDMMNEKEPLLSKSESAEFYQKERTKPIKPSLYRVLIRTYWKQWFFSSFLKIIDDIFALGQPFILKYIIDIIETKKPDESPDWRGYTLAILFFLAGMGTTIFYSQSAYVMMRLGLQMKTAVIGIIYKKALTMSNASKKNYSVGDIVNLMSVDCQRLQDAFQFQYEIVSFFVMIALGLYLIWIEMGLSTVGSLVVIVVVAIIQIWFGKLQEVYQIIILKLKSSRIRLLKEVLNGIKVLKMYTWEPSFTSKVLDIRDGEMKFLKKVATVTSWSLLLSIHSPFLMQFSILMLYVLLSSSSYLSASKVFTALSTVNILRFSLTMTPFVVTGVTQLYVSVGRIQEFLWKEDLDTDNVSKNLNSDYAVSIENGTFTWDREDPNITLKNIDVKVPDGKLVAVVGQVGSGKSSLVSAMLGELEKVGGKVNVKGSIAYVPQEAWIQNLTVKDNILFGETYIERKYQKVIKACALLPDLAILSAGDQTEIGEKGINVSGGQKQRISLARAVYNNCDVYFLDDPLSAVDSHVGKDLFRNVIGNTGLLKHKTRILVTHGVHWLPMVDSIIVMEHGRIREMGTYEELLQKRGAFAEFLQTYLLHGNQDEDEEDHEISKMKDQIWEQVENAMSDYDGISAEEGLSRRKSMRKASQGLILKDEIQKSAVGPDSMTRRRSKITMQRQISETQSAITESLTRGNMPKLHRAMSQGRSLPFDDEKEDHDEKASGSLTTEETTKVGTVKLAVFIAYIRAMGTFGAFFSVFSMAVFQGLNVYGNFYLTFWTEDDLLKNQSLSNTDEYADRNLYYLGVYTLLGVIQGIFIFLFGIIGLRRLVRAAGNLHSTMLHCVMRSPMSFFDTTPLGRIMNRFSSDVDILDDRLPRTYRLFNAMFFSMIGILVVISINTPAFLIAIVPVGIFYVLVLRFYLPTARQLKRIESVTRSPIYNHFSETISGASSIRAYRAADRFVDVSHSRVDRNSAFYFAAISGSWWIGVRLEFLGNILVLAAALFSIIQTDISGADIGLSLTYSMQIIIALNLVVQAVSEMEMNVVSAERVEEYTVLQPEAEWILPAHRPSPSWPETGKVNFVEYTTRYRPGLDLVLRGINCNINDGEKVGIVGRTGAGKSSLTLSLFRLIEAAGGGIDIDGQRISDIGLHDLRSKITILPQDPVLFSGPLRQSLDPLELFTDADIWLAIERAHLKPYIMTQPAKLNMECGEGGSNFSVGQRQLVCLARTLLHKTKVLILDEATAAVDIETDELIQETIRTEFSECTVLTIAHRLNTVMDYDRIMVLDKGLIVEFDSPKKLLTDKEGVFYKMAKDANLVG
ncbi:hypothetical protein FSP39_014366 [Pinctada imbricata]|uniref:ABC-type glutathione-S-conjugate transporter n=1 Tax=Pinctada imbricata TaxID=66713 RepID=A0AA88Y6H1_PINIB|nr:hypothetical protein FSP39_014366 [Pinctada imbricata]